MAQLFAHLAKQPLERIHSSIQNIHDITGSELPEIQAICRMAIRWIETPKKHDEDSEVLKQAFRAVWGKSCELEHSIAVECESLGVFSSVEGV